MSEEKKRQYIDVNIPNEWKPFFDQLLEQEHIKKQLEMDKFRLTYSGLGCWIIYHYLLDNTDFRFEHFNLDVNKGIVRITDKKRRMIADVYFRRKGELPVIWCELDNSQECEHIKYALKIPKITEALNQNGWIVTSDGKLKKKRMP